MVLRFNFAPWLFSLLLLGLGVLWASGPAWSQPTPFGAPAAEGAPRAAPMGASEKALGQSAYGRFWNWVLETQHRFHRQLAGAVRKLKAEGSLAAAWILIGLGFVYGVVHALGPGHGKAVITSYVLANERTVKRGILLSFLASMIQALTAVAIIAVLALAMNAAGLQIKGAAATLETASYALIAVIGLWLLVLQLRPGAGAHGHHHDHEHGSGQGHGVGEGCGHAHMPDPRQLEGSLDLKRLAAIVLAVGIRPCSGALIVLVFAIAQGILWAGVLATFAMAVGTAITVSTLAVLAVTSKQLAFRLAGDDGRWSSWLYRITAVGGSAAVMLIGAVLFVGSLGPARPF